MGPQSKMGQQFITADPSSRLAGKAGFELATPCTPSVQSRTSTAIEMMHRIRKGPLAIGRLGVQGRVASAVWNAVLWACKAAQHREVRSTGPGYLHQNQRMVVQVRLGQQLRELGVLALELTKPIRTGHIHACVAGPSPVKHDVAEAALATQLLDRAVRPRPACGAGDLLFARSLLPHARRSPDRRASLPRCRYAGEGAGQRRISVISRPFAHGAAWR